MSAQTVDVLVIGQGLAGSVLTCEAWSRGLTVAVIDNNHAVCASEVAAGMWNPVSFRRIIEVWRAEETMRFLQEKYPQWEKELGASFFYPKPVYRVFPNQEYADLWQTRLEEGMPWIQKGDQLEGVNAPFGFGIVPDAGFVHLPRFMSAVRSKLEAQDCFFEAQVAEEEVTKDGEYWVYQNVRAKHVVWSVGTSGKNLKQMAELPLQTNKGEVLEINGASLPTHYTLNNGKWLLPYGEGVFKLGSSYEWQKTDTECTDEVKQQLLDRIGLVLETPLEVIGHQAGLRPTVKDRRPLIGTLPNGSYCFNGLGTRGVLIAPFLANAFFDSVLQEKPLPSEVNLNRFT